MGLSKGRRLTIQRIFEKCIKERNGIWTVQRGQDIRKIQNRHATKSGEEEGEKEGSIEEKVVKKESGNKEEDCDKEKEFVKEEEFLQKEDSFQEKDCVQKEDGFKEKGCLEEEDRIEKEDWQQQEEVNTMDLTIRMRARHRKKGEKMIFICTHLFFYSYYHQFNFIIPYL